MNNVDWRLDASAGPVKLLLINVQVRRFHQTNIMVVVVRTTVVFVSQGGRQKLCGWSESKFWWSKLNNSKTLLFCAKGVVNSSWEYSNPENAHMYKLQSFLSG